MENPVIADAVEYARVHMFAAYGNCNAEIANDKAVLKSSTSNGRVITLTIDFSIQ